MAVLRPVSSDLAWAVLRAPFELLARPGGGFLADDALARFSVMRRLGGAVNPPALDGFRLGLAFMASSPRGQHELDFEAQQAAILAAVGESRIDLEIDDSGDPEQLGDRLAELGGIPAVHLSCHGLTNWSARPRSAGVPVLLMEDEVGGVRPTTAVDLAYLLKVRPRLLFMSASLAATGDGRERTRATGARDNGLMAYSMATGLVVAGMPAVIDWDGSVGDRSATVFAERLYLGLAERADLAVAVGDARRALLRSPDPVVLTVDRARAPAAAHAASPRTAGRKNAWTMASLNLHTFTRSEWHPPWLPRSQA